ncbi:MAG: adenosylcobinamide-GDP ribazoletransferase [Alphaproteobacteria bacterium]
MHAFGNDLVVAFSTLTRLPMPHSSGHGRAARSIWVFPLVGAVVGAFGAGVLFAAHQGGLYGMLAAGLALGVQILVTGALHEDGLADVADGFGGGSDKTAKLKIMSDSRIGAYGVIALMLILGLRWNAIAALGLAEAITALIAAAVLGRLAIVGLLALLDPAKAGGFGQTHANPPGGAVAVAAVLGLGLAALLMPPAKSAAIIIVMALSIIGVAWLARRQIGGYTGDVLGAGEQIAETAILLTLVALT